MLALKKTIESEIYSAKINIKREYKLSQKSNFELWLDYLRSELQSNDLLDVIDTNAQTPEKLTEAKLAKRKGLVRDIIINHLDENYHKRILNDKEPKEILKKLRGFKKGETNVTHTSVRARLYQTKMRKDEKVIDFCERFDSIVREYEASEDAVPLTDQEKRSSFYQAVSSIVPELRNADLIRRQTTMKEMNLEEIKSFITQLEAEKRCDLKEMPKAQRVHSYQHGTDDRCHRCNDKGHWANDCSLQGTGKWFCYCCQGIRNHKGIDCPTVKSSSRSGFSNRGGASIRNGFRELNNKNTDRGGRKSYPKIDNRGKINKRILRGRGGNKWVPGKGQSSKTFREKLKQQFESGKCKYILDESSLEPNNKQLEFIADSGATDHIVNTNLILSDFRCCQNDLIKSANKNEQADIRIDGRGDLLLLIKTPKKRIIKLTDVIAAPDISENLLSLRRFADEGFSIYLDDKILKVYDRIQNKTILEGIYNKPNWTISFEVRKNKDKNKDDEYLEYDKYQCTARVVTSQYELTTHSQSSSSVTEMQDSEGEQIMEKHSSESDQIADDHNSVKTNRNSAIGRESSVIQLNCLDFEVSIVSRTPVQVDTLDSVEKLDELYSHPDPFEKKKPENYERYNEGMLWHIRLGHASLDYLKKLQKLEKSLEKVTFDNSILECEICIMAKMVKLPFKEQRRRAERPLQFLHTDTMGPINPTSYPGRKRFIVVFIDDYSRLARAYSIKTKDTSGESLERFLISARNLLGKDEKVCYIRSDQGTEFMGGKFIEIMQKEKIENDPSPPYTPEHNGVAERLNKTIQEKVRAYMFDSGLPKSMWELAVEAAVHAYNRTPHKSIDYQIPLKKFSPNASSRFEQIKRFGCIGYIKVPKPKTKFDERAIQAVLVGYTNTGYILWHPRSGKYLEARHVRFNEKIVYKNVFKMHEIKTGEELNTERGNQNEINWEWMNMKQTQEKEQDKIEETEKEPEPKKRGRPFKTLKEENKHDKNEQNVAIINKGPMTRGRAKRQANTEENEKRIQSAKPIEDTSFTSFSYLAKSSKNNERDNVFEEDELIYCLLTTLNKDPVTYQEAMMTRDKEKWQGAIKDELDSMRTNKVWKLVDRPHVLSDGSKANIIDSKWVFKKKLEVDGTTRFKARLVIRGFKDKTIYDLKETYAPVSRLSLVRSVLATINKYNLYVCQLDVKTAFLNGILDEEIYMEIPDGFEIDDLIKRGKVCKLEKSLYGLKISPKKWNKRFTEEALRLGLENDLHEPCLFTWRKEGKFAVLVLYVDDMLVASNCESKVEEIRDQLGKMFEMKNLGEPKNFLGMTIERDRHSRFMKLHQTNYIECMLDRFHMKECKPQSTPMVTGQVNKQNKRRKLVDQGLDQGSQIKEQTTCKVPYREAIGSLMYLANATRPDITFAVNYLARKQIEPTEEDWIDVKRVFRYLRGTTNFGLIYRGKEDALEAMTDASFRDHEDSTSTSGYVITLFGDVIGWKSHKQVYVTLSTCQAEYLAMSEACQELISLDKGIRYVVGKTFFPVTIWCDNKSARDCTEKDGNHKLKMFDDDLRIINRDLEQREKTGSRRHMGETHGDYIKLCVIQNKVRVKWITTKENLADIMTKPLPLEGHRYLRDKIMNHENNES